MGNCSSASPVHPPLNQVITTTQNHENVPTTPVNKLNEDTNLEQAKREFEIKYDNPTVKTAKIEDFQLQRIIGTGSLGRVMLAKHGDQSLVLKIMEKKIINETGQVKQILSEKRILQAISSPFIVNLIYAFKDNSYLYVALEFASGGEMFYHLRKKGMYSEDHACFYAAQIVLALEYLHYLNIIYRNVKPEDILFTADGYLKLTDFRFAKVVKDRTFTLCGTPDYLAPEIITGNGHNKSVDYWSLGILIYEMTSGSTPFAADDPMESYKNIISGKFDIPKHFSSNLKDLVCKLLELRPRDRYGCLKAGVNDIKNHQWFSSIDWIAIGEKRLPAPFIPEENKESFKQYDEKPLEPAETDLYPDEFDDF